MSKFICKGLVGLRNGLSQLMNWKRPKTEWYPNITSLAHLKAWMRVSFEYKHDLFGGIIDNTRSVGNMFWEYRRKGKVRGDCDDAATLYAWVLKKLRTVEPVKGIWRVTIPSYRHVICVWEYAKSERTYYQYSSGRYIFPSDFAEGKGWSSIRLVVDAYGFRKGKEKRLGVGFWAEPVEDIKF